MDTINNITIGWIFAALLAISGAIAAIKNIDEPFKRRREMLDNHEEEIAELKKFTEEQTRVNKVILKTLNAMVNHEIDGNGIERLKMVRDELQTAIIDNQSK